MQATSGRPKSPNNKRYGAIYPVNGGACNEVGQWVQSAGTVEIELRQQASGFEQAYMPMVWITSKAAFEMVLDSPELRQVAIDNLVELATTREDAPWDGVDFDIETIDDSYRDTITGFYTNAIEALHKVGIQVNLTAMASDRDSGLWGNRHAFDFEVLGQIADSITVMLYTSFGMSPNTAPGPYEQSERVLQYILSKGVSQNKLFAGLSIASRYVDYATPSSYYLSYAKAIEMISNAGAEIVWYAVGDDGQVFNLKRASWTDHDVWIIDADVLKVHIGLVDKYGIGGACLFVPGSEDPSIWPMLDRKKKRGTNGNRNTYLAYRRGRTQ